MTEKNLFWKPRQLSILLLQHRLNSQHAENSRWSTCCLTGSNIHRLKISLIHFQIFFQSILVVEPLSSMTSSSHQQADTILFLFIFGSTSRKKSTVSFSSVSSSHLHLPNAFQSLWFRSLMGVTGWLLILGNSTLSLYLMLSLLVLLKGNCINLQRSSTVWN